MMKNWKNYKIEREESGPRPRRPGPHARTTSAPYATRSYANDIALGSCAEGAMARGAGSTARGV